MEPKIDDNLDLWRRARLLVPATSHCRTNVRPMHNLRNRPSPSRCRAGVLATALLVGWPLVGVSRAGDLPPERTATIQSGEAVESTGPLSAADALDSFEIAAGLRLETVACEPLVVDPVAIRFDEDGRMWVVEMRDYPTGPPPGHAPLSRIRILDDDDGDGTFDRSHVFAEELLLPTGIQPWNGGAIVTLAGRIDYLKDTDGDLRADTRETWYTGFAEQNSQLRANHPTLGVNNRVYVANGLRGGNVVTAGGSSQEAISLRGRDFAFHPVTRAARAVSGNGQYGLTFDDFGNRFVCSNRNPLQHVVLEDRYARKNPLLAVPAVVQDVARAGEASRLFPISSAWTTSNLHAGQFTAACGVTMYLGSALPTPYDGTAMVCDPTGNLIHCEAVFRHGATFDARRVHEDAEMLASRDEWFRPVDLAIGPDGALYIADMYRAVIEHPDWMPEELRHRTDLRDGDDRGRIYRLSASTGPRSASARPQLSRASSGQVVALLEHPEAWWRNTAARLLLERADTSVQQAVRRTARDAQDPRARLTALWTLAGLEVLAREDVLHALHDPHPEVRRNAIILAETDGTVDESLRADVLGTAEDPHAAVRFQAALSLAPAETDAELDGLNRIGVAGADDPWTRWAVGIAAGRRGSGLLGKLLNSAPWRSGSLTTGQLHLVGLLSRLAGSTGEVPPWQEALHALLTLPDSPQQGRLCRLGLLGLARGLAEHGQTLAGVSEGTPDREVEARFQKMLDKATRVALGQTDNGDSLAMRLEAIDLLAYCPEAADALARLSLSENDAPIRVRAIAALSRHEAPRWWRRLLEQFPSATPAVRRAIIDALLARPRRTQWLLDAIEDGSLRPGELDRTRVDRLLHHRNTNVKRRATQLFRAAIPADRAQVLTEYRPVLEIPADSHRGHSVFRKHCATCHRIGDTGVDVGPDISDSRTKTPLQLLTDILQPNRAIDSNYIGYSVLTADGRALSGILVAETGNSVTIRQEENKTVTLRQDQIQEIQSTGISLMPEGLERDIPHQDMADLIAYIKNWRYLDGRIPLVSPPAGAARSP